jgi:uncharacterized protein YggE
MMATVLAGLLMSATAGRAADVLQRTISSSGEAVVYVAPDEVSVSLGVEQYDKQLDRAKAMNDEQAGKLVQAIKDLGVEDKHIQATHMDVDVRYVDGSLPSKGIDGYYTRRTYAITLKDTKLFEKLIDTALKSGANRLAGFEFRTTELRKYRDQARAMAMKAAKEKAAALAKELDCKPGKPLTISETGGGYFGWNGWNGRANAMQNAMQEAPGGAGGGEGAMPLGQIAVQARVSVTFELKDMGE